MPKPEMPKQKIKQRIKNFNEVSLGLTKKEIQKEAMRCLLCKEPQCQKGCPVGIDIPGFIKRLQEGDFVGALEKIKEKNNLPAICGRVCPKEDQCELRCILRKKDVSISIGDLERSASDLGETFVSQNFAKKDTKIAIIGSGPAGLTAAADLAKMGYQVTLFESLHKEGGVLSYGIPEFRLPKKIVEEEVNYIKSLGVNIKTNFLVGKTATIDELFEDGFKAVLIATGAGLPQFLGIEGENTPGVYSANEFLTRINLMKAYEFPKYKTPIKLGEKVLVIGAGNVAYDAARCAIRLGKDVTLVYRRTQEEMPAREEEIVNAEEEGLKFQLLTQPIKVITKDRKITGLECIKMELGEPDESGRKKPIPIKDSNFILEADNIIIAIGQNPNPLLTKLTPNLKLNKNGTIWTDENLMTSIKGVFAAGDIASGADTVISAMGAAKKAAIEIDKYLKKSGSDLESRN